MNFVAIVIVSAIVLGYLFNKRVVIYTGPDKFGTDPRLGPDRPCIHTGPPGTGTMWIHLPGMMSVHLRKGPSTDLDRSRSRVNGQD